jgi:hypothetical protein
MVTVSLERSHAMRRKFGEIVMSVGAVGLLLLVLISFDNRVREELSLRWSAGPTAELAMAGRHARQLTSVIAQAAHDQSMAHMPMLLFVFAGAVLLLFMVRT